MSKYLSRKQADKVYKRAFEIDPVYLDKQRLNALHEERKRPAVVVADCEASIDYHEAQAAELIRDNPRPDALTRNEITKHKQAALKAREERDFFASRVPAEAKRPDTYSDFTARYQGVSYFRDRALVASSTNVLDGRVADAKERLRRHNIDMSQWRGKAGQYRDQALRELQPSRGANDNGSTGAEYRTPMSTAVGYGGEAVAPAYLIERASLYRPSLCSFSARCARDDLPAHGMTVIVPSITSPATVGEQPAENQGITQSSVTTAYRGSSGSQPFFAGEYDVQLAVGSYIISQQLHDRGTTAQGRSADDVLIAQLTLDYWNYVDTVCLQTALDDLAGTVTDSTSWSVQQVWTDTSKAKQLVATTAGVAYRPTHLFVNSNQVDQLGEQLDSEGRPLFDVDWATATNEDDGATGLNINNLALLRDDNIPTLDGNNQWLVARPQSLLLLTGAFTTAVIPQQFAGELSVTLQLRSYIAAISQRSSYAAVTGSTYADSEGA
jgi:hypothetical protein